MLTKARASLRSTLEVIRSHALLILVTVLIVAAAVLRFPLLEELPTWNPDEGFYVQMSWNVIHGNLETFGVNNWSFVSPLFTVPPGFLAFIGLFLVIFGKSILVLRVITVIFGIATVFSLWYIGSKLYSKYIALLPAAAYALIPVIVLHNRWGYPQTAAGFFLLWAFYFLIVYLKKDRKKFLWFSIIFFSAASLTVYWTIPFVLVYVVALAKKIKFNVISIIALALAPLLIVLGLRALTIPDIFFADLQGLMNGGFVTLSGAPEGIGLHDAIVSFFKGLWGYATNDALILLSTIGLFFFPDKTIRNILLTAFFALSIPAFIFRPFYDIFFYSALIFTPLCLLGLGALQNIRIQHASFAYFPKIIFALACFYIIFIGIIGGILFYSGVPYSPIFFLTSPDVPQMKEVIAYVNKEVSSTDLVIAPNIIGSSLVSRYTAPVFVACYENRDLFVYLDDSRFNDTLEVSDAKLFVDDIYFGGDISVCYHLRPQVYEELRKQEWPIVFETERFKVYRNPIAR